MNLFGKNMRLWTVVPSGGDVFETRYAFNGYKVDLSAHTCTCNLWMIYGIPCVHAQAVINFIHKDAVNFIDSWYHKKNYIAVYTDNILPVNGSNMWPRTEFIKPLPPLVRRMPGRPKVKRRKHATEAEDAKYPTQRVKQSRTVRCGNCQNLGHNRNSCKNNTTPRAQEPKRKNGRPRKDGSGQPSIDHFPPRPTVTPRTERGEGSSHVSQGTEGGEGTSHVPQGTEGGEGTSHVPQGTEPVKTPMKRFKMVAKRGGKGKSVHRSPIPTKNQVPTQDSQIGDDFFEELLQQPPYIPYTAFEGNYNDHNVHTYMEEVENYKSHMRKTQKRFRFDENENLGGVGNEAEKTGLNDVAVEYDNENETEVELENEVNVQVDNLDEVLDEVENDIMSTDQIVRNMIECGYQQHEIDETLQNLNEENCINENNENKEREEVLEQEGKSIGIRNLFLTLCLFVPVFNSHSPGSFIGVTVQQSIIAPTCLVFVHLPSLAFAIPAVPRRNVGLIANITPPSTTNRWQSGPTSSIPSTDQHMQETENDRNNNSNSNSAPASIATHTRTIGIIHPPPDIRTIVDKTASFVAKNGPEIIISNAGNPKFNFLNGSDPYHAYYQHRMAEFRSQNQNPTDVPPPETAAPATDPPETIDPSAKFRPVKKILDPPEAEQCTNRLPEGITGEELDIIKLTAQFVARNGKSLMFFTTSLRSTIISSETSP
ncbi:hypothetical protein LXL04_007742 [Taraxacum kok-saghyz]